MQALVGNQFVEHLQDGFCTFRLRGDLLFDRFVELDGQNFVFNTDNQCFAGIFTQFELFSIQRLRDCTFQFDYYVAHVGEMLHFNQSYAQYEIPDLFVV